MSSLIQPMKIASISLYAVKPKDYAGMEHPINAATWDHITRHIGPELGKKFECGNMSAKEAIQVAKMLKQLPKHEQIPETAFFFEHSGGIHLDDDRFTREHPYDENYNPMFKKKAMLIQPMKTAKVLDAANRHAIPSEDFVEPKTEGF